MKFLHIVGARPNFMKAAPLLEALAAYPQIHNLLVHTGQHYDANMSEIFFDELGLPRPDIHLGVGSGTHAEQTANILLRFEPVLREHQPDWIVVYGDVNSTLACTLAAAKLEIPVAHVEAGVRSFDRSMPEEINRLVTDALASLHFTPCRQANDNLQREGIPAEKIHFVGNIMADSLLKAVPRAAQRETWNRWGLSPQGYGLVTLHRAANVDSPTLLSELIGVLSSVATRLPLVFPVHPRTAKRLADFGLASSMGAQALASPSSGLILCEPLGYLDFVCLMRQARLVLTDSGGLQAETSILGIPCLTLRKNTEWNVTVSEGTNTLVPDIQGVPAAAEEILRGAGKRGRIPELWDGRTGQRIAAILAAL